MTEPAGYKAVLSSLEAQEAIDKMPNGPDKERARRRLTKKMIDRIPGVDDPW